MPDICPTCLAVLPDTGVPCAACTRAGRAPARAPALALMGLSLVAGACGDKDEVVALYGVEITDADDDGWWSEEDCDDNDPDIHPEAEETPGDGVDSNCNGEDDT